MTFLKGGGRRAVDTGAAGGGGGGRRRGRLLHVTLVAGAAAAAVRGRAEQVDPIKHVLKAPGSKRLKVKYHAPLSNFAFKSSLRRYTEGSGGGGGGGSLPTTLADALEAGAYTRPLLTST